MAIKEDPSWKKRRATEKPSEAEAPDAFQTTTARLIERLRPHLKLMGLGLAVGVVLWATVFTMRYFKNKKAMRNTAAFGKALKVGVESKVQATEPDKDVLDDPGAPQIFKTEAERGEAFLKALGDAKKLGGSFATNAELLRAATLFKLAKYDEAATAYKAFLDKAKSSPFRFAALEGLGYALEAKGDLDGALARFAELDPDPKKTGSGLGEERALWHQGRILSAKGDKAKAIEVLKKLVADFPSSPLKAGAEDRLAALEST